MFPQGRGRLWTTPEATGSPAPVVTIGIVEVACLSTGSMGPEATITSTWRRTSSVARPGERSGLSPPPRASVTKCSPYTASRATACAPNRCRSRPSARMPRRGAQRELVDLPIEPDAKRKHSDEEQAEADHLVRELCHITEHTEKHGTEQRHVWRM